MRTIGAAQDCNLVSQVESYQSSMNRDKAQDVKLWAELTTEVIESSFVMALSM